MRTGFKATLRTLVFLGLVAPSHVAHASTMVAGWDFSQFFGNGLLSIDAQTATDFVDANYSDFDPTFGVGAESAAFGTLYFGGQFGSLSFTIDFSGDEPFTIANEDLISNRDAPREVDFGSSSALNILEQEGQLFQQNFSGLFTQMVDVVFEADLRSEGLVGNVWTISFAGISQVALVDGIRQRPPALVTFESSTDGANYVPIGSVTVDEVDTRFELPLDPSTDGAERVFVRVGFDPAMNERPILDNVALTAIQVPEPAETLAGGAALASLALLYGLRRRRIGR